MLTTQESGKKNIHEEKKKKRTEREAQQLNCNKHTYPQPGHEGFIISPKQSHQNTKLQRNEPVTRKCVNRFAEMASCTINIQLALPRVPEIDYLCRKAKSNS